MVADIKSERWPASRRNGWPASVGIRTYVFDASYRFTHPVGIQLDVDLPRDLAQTRLGGVTLSIRQVLRTGTL